MTETKIDFDNLIEKYGKLVSKLAWQYCGTRDLADDASQEAWAAIIKSLPSYRGESELSTWIYRIVVRTLMRFSRLEFRQSFRDLQTKYVEADLIAPASDEPQVTLWVKDICSRCMIGVLHCLDSRTRMIYLLKQQCNFEYSEIARALKISTVNARKIFSRSREQLRHFMMRDCCYAKNDPHCGYGLGSQVPEAQLAFSISQLRNFDEMARPYKLLPELLPDLNFWDRFLGIKNVVTTEKN